MNDMNQPTTLHIIRHGETEWNKKGLIQGFLDSPLTSLGKQQAHAAGKTLSKTKFDCLYSSDLGRAFETAQIINSYISVELIAEKGLRERNLGVAQGGSLKDFMERFPGEYTKYASGNPDYQVPQGESARERYSRSIECIEKIAGRHALKRIAIVTHGGVLDGIFRKAVGLDLSARRRFTLLNASVNIIEIRDGIWKLLQWGYVDHFDNIEMLDDWAGGGE